MGCAGNVLGVNVRLFNIKVNYWHIYGSAIKRNRKRKWPKACSGSEDLVLQSIHKAMKFYILIKKQTNRQTKVNKEISVTLTSCKKKKNRKKKKRFLYCFWLRTVLFFSYMNSIFSPVRQCPVDDNISWTGGFKKVKVQVHWHYEE